MNYFLCSNGNGNLNTTSNYFHCDRAVLLCAAPTNTATAHHVVNQELELYLSDESKQLNSLVKFQLVKELFLNVNTRLIHQVLPGSNFSASEQILILQRSRLK